VNLAFDARDSSKRVRLSQVSNAALALLTVKQCMADLAHDMCEQNILAERGPFSRYSNMVSFDTTNVWVTILFNNTEINAKEM
jgi:hypothetical protein